MSLLVGMFLVSGELERTIRRVRVLLCCDLEIVALGYAEILWTSFTIRRVPLTGEKREVRPCQSATGATAWTHFKLAGRRRMENGSGLKKKTMPT
jgi:hypothetical protein